MAERTIRVDVNNIYKFWRLYLMAHTDAKYFGTVFDPTKVAEFPYGQINQWQ